MAIDKIKSESLDLTDDYTFTGTISGQNEPAFLAIRSSNQSISQNTWTKMQFQKEDFDTDSAYDKDTNYRFTVPTGKSGKYLFQTGITMNNQFAYAESALYVNGSEAYRGTSIRQDTSTLNSSFLIDLDASDYVEVYCKQDQTGQNIEGSNTLRRTFFSGLRIGN